MVDVKHDDNCATRRSSDLREECTALIAVGPRSDKYEDISNSLGGLPSTEKGVKNKEDKRLLAFVGLKENWHAWFRSQLPQLEMPRMQPRS